VASERRHGKRREVVAEEADVRRHRELCAGCVIEDELWSSSLGRNAVQVVRVVAADDEPSFGVDGDPVRHGSRQVGKHLEPGRPHRGEARCEALE